MARPREQQVRLPLIPRVPPEIDFNPQSSDRAAPATAALPSPAPANFDSEMRRFLLDYPVRWVLSRLLLLAALPLAVCGQGSPPLNTNDTAVVGAGAVEINLGWTHARSSAVRETEFPILDVTYGLNAAMELSYTVAWIAAQPAGLPRESGPGNSTLGFKWIFHNGGPTGSSFSLSPQCELNNPGSASERKGLADQGATLVLPFQWQRELGGWTVSADAGRVFHFLRADEWYAGAALSRDVNETLTFGAELFLEAAKRFDRSTLLLNVGGSLKLSERYSLLFALGRDLHRHGGDLVKVRGYLGWQIRL